MKRVTFQIVVLSIVLSACVPPTPAPSPQVVTQSKIGLHIVPGRRTGFGAFLQSLIGANVHLAIVKAVDDLSPLREVERLMPGALTVGRLNSAVDPTTGVSWDLQAFKPEDFNNSPREAAEVYLYLVAAKWVEYSEVNIWELFNEYSSNLGWQGAFFIEMMKTVDSGEINLVLLAFSTGNFFERLHKISDMRIKLVLYAFSTGNPPLDEATIAEITPALRYAMAHGHYVSSHAYGGVLPGDPETLEDSYLALYHRGWYAMLPADARPQLIISEAGQSGGCCFIGTQAFVEDYRWYDAQLSEDDYVVGVAVWTLGNWGSANFQDALPALADYLISFEPPPPAPIRFPIYLPLILSGQ